MTGPFFSTEDLRRRVGRLPRIELAHLPTPLEETPRFAERLGGGVRLFIKRDDCTGLLFGGNKTRHNEFLLADALHKGADVVVWGAGIQSNNCRQTAAACARLGLECHLFLTRWAALGLIVIQIGAIYLVTWAQGFTSLQGGGYGYNVALIAMLVALVLAGGGALALDRLLPWGRRATAREPATMAMA